MVSQSISVGKEPTEKSESLPGLRLQAGHYRRVYVKEVKKMISQEADGEKVLIRKSLQTAWDSRQSGSCLSITCRELVPHSLGDSKLLARGRVPFY